MNKSQKWLVADQLDDREEMLDSLEIGRAEGFELVKVEYSQFTSISGVGVNPRPDLFG